MLDEREIFDLEMLSEDWLNPNLQYFKNPSSDAQRSIRQKALRYVLIDDVLYRRGFDGFMLRCVGEVEADNLMWQVHDGVCGSHQAGHKMRWLIRRQGNALPSLSFIVFHMRKVVKRVSAVRSLRAVFPVQLERAFLR